MNYTKAQIDTTLSNAWLDKTLFQSSRYTTTYRIAQIGYYKFIAICTKTFNRMWDDAENELVFNRILKYGYAVKDNRFVKIAPTLAPKPTVVKSATESKVYKFSNSIGVQKAQPRNANGTFKGKSKVAYFGYLSKSDVSKGYFTPQPRRVAVERETATHIYGVDLAKNEARTYYKPKVSGLNYRSEYL